MGLSTRSRSFVVTLGVAAFTIVMIAPLAWMLSVSLMATGEAASQPPPFLPHVPTLGHYRQLFADYGIGRPLINSLGLATTATVLGLCSTLPAGYALAKLRFRGRELMLRLLLLTLVIPGQVAMLPLFLMLRSVHLVNTYVGALLPSLVGIFSVLFVRQASLSIPDEMLEAARLDGATEAQIFLRVALPLLRPAAVTLGLFIFFANWDDFLWPLIVLADQRLYTLPVTLAALSREHVQDVEVMMAAAVVTAAPILIIFTALQRFYMAGLTAGSVKG